MTYAAVASLSHTIDLLLNHRQHSISPKLKNQMISLQKNAIFLESFLEESPQKVDFWEEEVIREGTDIAEAIIELLSSDSPTVESSKPKFEKGKGRFPYGFNELRRVAEQIESIVNGLKGIHTEAMDAPDDELTRIISLLRGGSSSPEKIGIYGTEGMGKTTLAKNVYNNPLIIEHFAVRAWATVSVENDLLRIASKLLDSIKAEETTRGDFASVQEEQAHRARNKRRTSKMYRAPFTLAPSREKSVSNSDDDLIRSLFEKLIGRRYLIVLDDIRRYDVLHWLNNMLPHNREGSRIMLTSKTFQFVKSVNHFHKMGFVDNDKAWIELRKEMFKEDPCPPQLESIGNMIFRRCRGNRLAIKVVAGILAVADQTEAAWEDILENMNNAFEEKITNAKVLSLSYTYLPHHLRPCFLYLAIFPKYDGIHVSKLIKLWVAEGFLNESDCKSFEETGEEHVEDLIRRNLVRVSARKSNGKFKRVKFNEYEMWEFCLRQASTDKFFLHESKIKSFDRQSVAMELQSCRRVSTCSNEDDFLGGVNGSTIRTIILFFDHRKLGGSIRWSIGNVRQLRILDLSNAYNINLVEEVFELFHLRYLAFHCGFSISEAISNLENLQTLIIYPRQNDGAMFGKLPEGVWRMLQLRYVIVFHFELPNPKGVTTCALENLQTLSRVVDFICSRENLKMIPNLKKLAVFYSKNSKDVVEEYELHNLIYLKKLEILKIEMNWSSFGKERKISTHCVFPPTLKKLNLCGVQLPWADIKIVASLPNLQVLKLRKKACIGKRWETIEGGFSQLTYLLIEDSCVKNWITKSSHFPKLKRLVIRCCLHLLEVPSDIGYIPTLESIMFDYLSPSRLMLGSAKRMIIQEDRQSLGYGSLKFYLAL